MIQQWGPEALAHILQMNSIGEILSWLCDRERLTSGKPKVYSYAEVARLLNYKSRSYIREVAEKKAKPNLQLVQRFAQYFKLNAAWKKYFELLCKQEIDADSKLEVEIVLQRQKLQKLAAVLKTSFEDSKSDFYIQSPLVPIIYSALGSFEVGASLKDIVQRTSLAEAQIQPALDKLIESSGVVFQQGRYFAKNNQVLIERCNDQDVFINDLNWTIKNLQSRINSKNVQPDELLFLSTYSIADKNLATFKQKLAALLTEFSTETESPDGNTVVNLSAFLTLNK